MMDAVRGKLLRKQVIEHIRQHIGSTKELKKERDIVNEVKSIAKSQRKKDK
jgi:hypothetical protein